MSEKHRGRGVNDRDISYKTERNTRRSDLSRADEADRTGRDEQRRASAYGRARGQLWTR